MEVYLHKPNALNNTVRSNDLAFRSVNALVCVVLAFCFSHLNAATITNTLIRTNDLSTKAVLPISKTTAALYQYAPEHGVQCTLITSST